MNIVFKLSQFPVTTTIQTSPHVTLPEPRTEAYPIQSIIIDQDGQLSSAYKSKFDRFH